MKRSVILILCTAVGGAAVLAGSAALWRWRVSHRTVYTDGQTIKQPIRHAFVRDVLWEPPKALPASINSAEQESQPRLSADGLSLYFVRRDAGGGGGADIFVSMRRSTADESWSEPQPLVEINTSDDETGPVPSADGQSLFFCSNRAGGLGGDDLWVSQRGELGWQPPMNLGASVNTEFDERGPALPNNRTALYFSSNRPRADAASAQTQPAAQQRDDDLYVASILNTGEILPAAPLAALNSPSDDRSPAISPAGDFLYFSSDRPGSRGGFDLYRAWLVRGELQAPINLGAEVNTAADERDPTICLAGFGLYFSSDRIIDAMEAPAHGVQRDANIYCTTSREVFTEVEPAGPLVDWASMWALLGPTILWLLLGVAAIAMLVVITKRMRSGKLSLLARCLLASLAAHLLIMVLLTFWRVTTSLAHIVQNGEIKIAMSSRGGDALAAQIRGELTEIAPTSARGELNRAQGDVAMEPAQSSFALAAAKQDIPLESSSIELHSNEAPIPDRTAIAPVAAPSVESSAAPPVSAPADAARLAMAEARQAPPSAQAPEQARDRASDSPLALQPAEALSATLQPQRAADRASDRSFAQASATDAPSASSAMPKPALEKLADAQAAAVSVAAPRASAPQRTAEAQPTSPAALAQQNARDRTLDASSPVQAGSTLAARVSPRPSSDAAESARTLAAVASTAESTTGSPRATRPLLDAPEEGAIASSSIAAPREGSPTKAAEAQPRAPTALDKPGGRERGLDTVPSGAAVAVTSARLSPKPQQGAGAANNHSLAATSPVGDSAASPSPGSKLSLEQIVSAGPANAAIATPHEGAMQQVAEAQPGVASTPPSSQRASASDPTQFTSAPPVAAALAPAHLSASQQLHSERSLASAAMAAPSDSPAVGSPTSRTGAVLAAVAGNVPAAQLPAMQAPASGAAASGEPAEAEVRIAAQYGSSASAQGGIAMGAIEPARSANAAIAPATQPASLPGSASSLASVSASISQSGAPDSRAAASGRASIDASLSNLPSTAAPTIGIPAANESATAAAGDAGSKPSAPSAVGGGKDRRADYVLARQAVHEGGISIAPSSASISSAKTDSSLATVNERALGNVEQGSHSSSGSTSSPSMADVLSSGIPALATAAVATPKGGSGTTDARTEASDQGALPVGPAAARAGNSLAGLVRGESRSVALAPKSLPGAAAAELQSSGSSRGAPLEDSPITLAGTSIIGAGAEGDPGDISLPAIDIRVPTEVTPLVNPYVARTEDKRMEIVKRMGGSDATERAVALALKWLAAHQSPDGRWAAKDFDDRCSECGGLAKFDTDIATTGLALLCFLGADHTHAKDGPYRQNVERGLNWLLQQQKPDGDLRGTETMYSHGIGTIAISESFGMTGDAKLLDPLKNAIDFIARARNRRTGGWRYEPGQVGDTSVLGWQVMAMISAKRAGLAIPAEALDSARQWLEVVGTATKPGLYAYQPGQRYSPSMTAEGMFVQQLLGMDHDDARMQASAEFVMQNPPRWNNDPNSYYWYYATLALFQYQGDAWKSWNKSITDELLANQRSSGAATGSWDPVDNWSKIGGRVYQTAVCTLCLEVYYRYLPMYAAVKTDEPKSNE